MGKKKREHVVFDEMLKTKKTIPFSFVNKQTTKRKKCTKIENGPRSRRQWSIFMSTKFKDSNTLHNCCKEEKKSIGNQNDKYT